MKKQILLLIVVMAMFAFNSTAQRVIDARVTLNYPTNGITIVDQMPLAQPISFTLTNGGPGTIQTGDSIYYGILMDGSVRGGTTFNDTFTMDLLPDSTVTYTYNAGLTFSIDPSWFGTSKDFCVFVSLSNNGPNTLVDPVQLNDTNCNSVNFDGNPASIGELNDIVASEIVTYPNPASQTVNVSFRLEKEEPVLIHLTDILGKVVSTIQQNNLQLGEVNTSFDVSSLKSGVYFIEIKVGNHSKVEKILVTH
jgi:hypothetical protein